MTTASIGNGIKNIGDNAFKDCGKLVTLKIGAHVTNVGYSAFSNCIALRSISVYNKEVPTTENYSFTSFEATLYVPAESVDAYKDHTTWGRFAKVEPLAETFYLTIKQAEGGTLKIATASGNNYVFVIQAEEGWKVNTITYNGTDVTTQIVDDAYTTPAITADAILTVSFEQASNGIRSLGTNNTNTKVYSKGNSIIVKGVAEGELVQVYGLDGKLENRVIARSDEVQINAQTGKVYIVKTAGKTVKLGL